MTPGNNQALFGNGLRITLHAARLDKVQELALHPRSSGQIRTVACRFRKPAARSPGGTNYRIPRHPVFVNLVRDRPEGYRVTAPVEVLDLDIRARTRSYDHHVTASCVDTDVVYIGVRVTVTVEEH